MGESTGIQWTDHTFNPWWGCTKVSPGCDHCYADTLSHRYGHDVWGDDKPRRFFGAQHWNEPLKWNRQAEAEAQRRRVFCASMADVFEVRADLYEERRKLWQLMASTHWLDWQLLTKRPQNIERMIPAAWWEDWSANVWFGTSVEDQANVKRLGFLHALPGVVHFASCEPLLGRVDIEQWLVNDTQGPLWVIVGGESGPHARPMNLDWVREIVHQCRRYGAACFVKQLGTAWAKSTRAKDSHGGDTAEWPEDLRVREFPEAVAQ